MYNVGRFSPKCFAFTVRISSYSETSSFCFVVMSDVVFDLYQEHSVLALHFYGHLQYEVLTVDLKQPKKTNA